MAIRDKEFHSHGIGNIGPESAKETAVISNPMIMTYPKSGKMPVIREHSCAESSSVTLEMRKKDANFSADMPGCVYRCNMR